MGVLREDVGLEARAAQVVLDREGVVADGIAVRGLGLAETWLLPSDSR